MTIYRVTCVPLAGGKAVLYCSSEIEAWQFYNIAPIAGEVVLEQLNPYLVLAKRPAPLIWETST